MCYWLKLSGGIFSLENDIDDKFIAKFNFFLVLSL